MPLDRVVGGTLTPRPCSFDRAWDRRDDASRAATLTLGRAALHREELLENWELCATNQTPKAIAPLDETRRFRGELST